MLINGIATQTLHASDRAISFGDGLFTTFRICDGQIAHLDAHLARLQSGCEVLGIESVAWPALMDELAQIAAAAPSLAVGKVVISRGAGGRGYSPEGAGPATRIVSHFPFPTHVQTWRKQGIVLMHGLIQLAIQPALAGLKSLNRLEQVLARKELIDCGAVEGVFCDSEGYVVECNAANLFWRRGDVIKTPALDLCGVAGIMRQQIIDFCQQRGHGVAMVRELPAVLDDADELFICNSVTGPVPVTRLGDRQYESHFLCRLLQKELDPIDWQSVG